MTDPLMNPNEKTLSIKGEDVTVGEFTVKTFRPVVHRVGVMMKLVKAISEGTDIAELCLDSYDGVLDIVRMNTGRKSDFVESLRLHELLKLVKAVVEVNQESFLLMKDEIEGMVEMMDKILPKNSKNDGQPVSSSSSKTDITFEK